MCLYRPLVAVFVVLENSFLVNSAQYSDLAYLGYKKDFSIFAFFGLVGQF